MTKKLKYILGIWAAAWLVYMVTGYAFMLLVKVWPDVPLAVWQPFLAVFAVGWIVFYLLRKTGKYEARRGQIVTCVQALLLMLPVSMIAEKLGQFLVHRSDNHDGIYMLYRALNGISFSCAGIYMMLGILGFILAACMADRHKHKKIRE